MVLGRAYYEGRKGLFFLSEIDVLLKDGHEIKIQNPVASNGHGADKTIDNEGSSGWSAGVGEEQHIILPLAEPIPANQSFSLSLLFERHFVASLGRFRISATSASNRPKVQKLGAKIEDLLATKKDLNPNELQLLKSTYLEKAFYSKKNVQAFDGHAKWIWDDKNNKVKQTLYFTKTIDLKKKPRSARLVYTCDDESEFFINGKKVASNSLWYEPVSVNVSSHFKEGTNILSVKATNNGGPGALIAQLEIISAEGKRQSHVTDQSWKLSEQEPEGNDWKTKGLSDGQESTIAGKAGDAPWKKHPPKIERTF